MARRRYRRYYKRRSGRWAPNIVKVSSRNTATTGEFYNYEDLAVNPAQSTNGVSQAFTVKNFEISFAIDAASGPDASVQLTAITAYIMYVPQGMTVGADYYALHPEYIMAYKFLGSPDGMQPVYNGSTSLISYVPQQNYQPFKLKSRLSRKLQTGDKIILFIQGSNSLNQTSYDIDGVVRWWSKAN